MKEKIKEIKATCEKYGFMQNKVCPYGFWETVENMISRWADYDRCTESSKGLIRAEIKGFEPILKHWIEYAEQPLISIKLLDGKCKGEVKEYPQSTAELFIESGLAVRA